MVSGVEAGALSIVPALLAIGLAWRTRDAQIGLFVGVVAAGVVYGALNPAAVGVPDDLIRAGPHVAEVSPQADDASSWSVGLGGVLLGSVFGLKVVPEIIATAPLFGPWYVENVLLAIFAIGGMIGLMIRSGAIRGVLEALADRVDDSADAEKAAFLAGIAVHIDDYFNCLVVGSMMRPLTDRFNVSRAKLAYYVDSAGSPAARLAFYSTWGAAMVGFIGGGIEQAASQGNLPSGMSGFVGAEGNAVTGAIWPLFFNTLFTGFYSWIALAIAALVAWQVFPNIFEMGREESRARAGNGVVGEDDDPMISEELDRYEVYEGATPHWRNFAVPILTMIVVGLGAMFWRASPVIYVDGATGSTLLRVAEWQLVAPPAGPWSFNIGGVSLGIASVAAFAVAFLMYRLQGNIPSNKDATDAAMVGFKGILLAAVILMFASSIQNAVTVLGVASFITATFGNIPAFVVPVVVFLTTAFVSFSDGSSWSTYGIMFPIAIPLAFATGANLPLVLGAVFSGGIFGDHSSPISDTTVLASSTSGSDHMVHVRSQIPYAVITAAITAALFLLFGFVLPEGFRVIPY
ncbi:Na+/H+ antiporter NhaC family protein [Halobacterium litoreum]|uniref:Na+/H+ antiporter NhaC family protein n=1 Tax=Halobacterium litoreum TaxID=2039234 RepID=A0ABD5NBD6_9EURY|nr:Na+/H+ antiporter NhaC family protein [Halobacterium litoreum]UHH14517.1 sodium:proton antiporter [Halobacterium litoreum]